MATPDGCPCDALSAVCERVNKLETWQDKTNEGQAELTKNFALIQQDLGYIKARLDDRKKNWNDIILDVLKTIAGIIIGCAAVKLGFG